MKLIQHMLTKNPCYTAGRKIEVRGLMLHSIGCPQPDASVFLEGWNKESYRNACVHGFIDGNDGTVYQTLPWDHRGWHCGSSANGTHIGIEMCEPDCIRYTKGSSFTCLDETKAREVVDRTYAAAVELFAYLCDLYDLDPLADGVIISHREGHERGIASNHGDPEHLWRGLHIGYTMDEFRKDVHRTMQGIDSKDKNKINSSEAGYEFQEYMVKVRIPNLNIRTGPGTNYAKTGEYTDDRLAGITHNGTEYEFEYDVFGNRTCTKAGGAALVRTEYRPQMACRINRFMETVFSSVMNTIKKSN